MSAECQLSVHRPSEKSDDVCAHQARVLDTFDAAVAGFGLSQRAFADAFDVPRSTLQGWLARRDDIDAHPAVVAFCESEVV
jgi:DNA-binding transcriptional regulator YiaG